MANWLKQAVTALEDSLYPVLCPVSVPILTQKSANYACNLLILIEFRTFAEREGFEPPEV